jgi:hypothetical protein
MSTIVTRAGKGSALTWAEGDANVTNLNNDKYQQGSIPTFGARAGIGVTPDVTNNLGVLTIGVTGSNIEGYLGTLDFLANAYSDTGPVHKYANSTFTANRLTQFGNTWLWRAAPAGTAGNPITWTTVMTGPSIGQSLALEGASQQTGTGITFPATQVASSNVNTLDDYEEGTWTPVDASGAGLSFTGAAGAYIKIGKQVSFWGVLTYPATASGANAAVGGLPFTCAVSASCIVGYSSETTLRSLLIIAPGTGVTLYVGAGFITNATMSGDQLYLSGTYQASN